MELAERDDVILAGRIIWIEPERVGVGDQTNVAPTKLAVRPGQMKIKAELLGDDVDENRIFCRRKLIHAFRPKRNGKTEQEHGLDQDNGEFQMRGNPTAHTGMISGG